MKLSGSPFRAIPLCCIPKRDLVLRRDVEILLQSVDIQLNELICYDECPLDIIPESIDFSITLVDHNKLSLPLSKLGNKVTEILDHHKDMGAYESVVGEMRDIAFEGDKATVGSCCTLIAERFLSKHASLLDSDIATLLMGVIALDTFNMCPKVAKGTFRDEVTLKSLCTISMSNLEHLFNTLKDAKNDRIFWETLTAADALRLDYKMFETMAKASTSVGIASVLLPFGDVLSKPDLITSVDKLLVECEFVLIMCFHMSPEATREVLVFSRDKSRLDGAKSYLVDKGTSFGFEEISTGQRSGNLFFSVFSQANTQMSRKQVAPFFLGFF